MAKYQNQSGVYIPTIELTSKPHTLEVKKRIQIKGSIPIYF